MKIIACFIPMNSGTASVCGYDVSTWAMEVRKKIGYLPESNPLYHEMYVKEYLHFMASLHQLGKNAKKRVEEMIDVIGLTEERKKKIGHLSKGYRQRVGLAQAMLHNPEVLILDEPTSGLDPNQLSEIRSLIKMLGKEKTVIISTHIMQEVQAICDRVIIIHRGKIVADDTTESLRQKAAGQTLLTVEFKEKIGSEKLLQLEGVENAVNVKGNIWNISAKGINDLREKIFLFAKINNLTLLSLNVESSTLEEVFQSLTK